MDLHVVGAGPAGSIAAISALRSGHSVIVSEEHASAGLPANCSGLFSAEGLETLSPYLDHRPHIINPIHGASLHFNEETVSVRRKEPVAYVCDRSGIDMQLASKAEDEGAIMRYGERVRGTFLSESVIGADGPHSSVARRFRFPPIRSFAATLQALIPYKAQDPSMVEVFISGERFPGFFGWVIPHDDERAEFGLGVKVPLRPIDAWRHLLRSKRIDPDRSPRPKGHAIPLSMRDQSAKRSGRRNVLLCGDAAGQVKSTTGGGVIFGGNCAALAGRHFRSPMRYELEWRLRFGPDLHMHRFFNDFQSSLDDAQLSELGRRFNRLDIGGFLSRSGSMDRPSRMVRPGLALHVIRNLAGLGR